MAVSSWAVASTQHAVHGRIDICLEMLPVQMQFYTIDWWKEMLQT